jgi:hypothetical protein
MPIQPIELITAAVMGVGATMIMDAWNMFLKRAFNIPSLNYCMLGRWLRHMPAAFRHASIAAAPEKLNECVTGWIAHYSIGVSLALGFVLLASGEWLAQPTLLPALLYGIGTVAFPFLVMQPSLGFGIASAKAPKPMQARLKSLTTHTIYGAGLYVCALGLATLV